MPLVLAVHLCPRAALLDQGRSWPGGYADFLRPGRSLQVGGQDSSAVCHATGLASQMSVPPHRRWTQTDIDDLRSGVSSGVEIEVIADTLGRTLEDTKAMVSRLRMRPGKGT